MDLPELRGLSLESYKFQDSNKNIALIPPIIQNIEESKYL